MRCVEGAVVAQVPGPNQYWEHIKSKDRAYFIGRDPDGLMVWQCEGDGIEVGNLDWSGWRHIPGCTGWDWEPDQVEEFPQYWTTLNTPSSSIAYIKRIDQSTLVSVCKDGTEVNDSVIEWKTDRRTRLTEQEALALLDKPDKRAEVAQNTIERIKRFDPASVPAQERAEQWPRFFINPDPDLKWYIRAENCIDAPLVYLEDGRTDTCKAEWTDIICFLGSGTWLEVTEAEAIAKIAVDKAPAEVWPKYYVGYQWNDKDAYIRYDGPESSGVWVNWHGTETVFAGDHYSEVAACVGSGSWRQVTEAEAKARVTKAIEPVTSVEFLPVAPEMDWVVQDCVPARNNVDEWAWCKRGRSPRHFYSGFGGWSSTIMHGHVDGDEVLHLRCRRKDLPNIESPEDWVTQDRVEARPGIDQGWWACDEQAVDHGAFKWWGVSSTDMVCTKKHGYCSYDGLRLYLRCKRKDLPPVPAPVEETFPQWYILKDDEKRSWVPDWTVKRTGEETSIRYARDEAGELYATNEPWTGAPDCWERCSDAEAIVRMGTSQFPRVPSEPRRVPVKLWVTYRLNDEGGDWPVRATQADQTCQNWKEIQFDGNGAFIEVEQ